MADFLQSPETRWIDNFHSLERAAATLPDAATVFGWMGHAAVGRSSRSGRQYCASRGRERRDDPGQQCAAERQGFGPDSHHLRDAWISNHVYPWRAASRRGCARDHAKPEYRRAYQSDVEGCRLRAGVRFVAILFQHTPKRRFGPPRSPVRAHEWRLGKRRPARAVVPGQLPARDFAPDDFRDRTSAPAMGRVVGHSALSADWRTTLLHRV